MKVTVKKRMFSQKELIKELEFEINRCSQYFDLMYKILQFTFLLISALIVFVFQKDISSENSSLILCLVLPVCTYVFGILYTYNAYALSVGGEKCELIHSYIYRHKKRNKMSEDQRRLYNMMCKYVLTDRTVTLLSYGVPLGFYLTIPTASCCLGYILFSPYDNLLFEISPVICLIIYYILMLIILIEISKKHFTINKIQKSTLLK